MHITYNAIWTGWQHDPGRAGWLAREAHTELFFEYTALLVRRPAHRLEEDTPTACPGRRGSSLLAPWVVHMPGLSLPRRACRVVCGPTVFRGQGRGLGVG